MPMTPHSLLKNQTSVIEIFKVFDKFSKISDLKKINQNAKLLGKGYRWHSAASNASSYMNRLLKFWKKKFSCNEKLEEEENFHNHISKIKNVLTVRRMRDLTIEGKILF